MTNLVSDSARTTYQSAIDDIHDTWARTITVWRQSSEVITSQDQNFDAFADVKASQVVYTTESQEFQARIKYIDRQDKEFGFVVAGTNIDVTSEFQLVRIKVNPQAHEYIKDCEKITIDGSDFIPLTVQRPHGLFGNDYFTIYLRSRP